MKQLIFIFCMGLFIITIQGCERNVLGPESHDSVPPDPVSSVKVQNMAGASILTYTLPKDTDLLYVKADYKTRKGVNREFKESYYNNSIKIDGFADTSAYQVKLYAVDESENVSAPVTVTVHPEKPPYLIALDSIKAVSDFGGMKVMFKNPDGGNLAIIVLADDSLGAFVPFNTYYTNLKQGDFSTRGFDSVKTRFGIYIRDQWNNISDTLMVTLKPYFEEKLDRTKMHGIGLPGDATLGYGGQIDYLFDGITTDDGGYYHTAGAHDLPSWFTFDMGVKAKLSRLKWWMRVRTGDQLFYYSLHNPEIVEIWGSNNPPADGSWNNWVLLAKHTQIKPSGLPIGELSQDDIQAAEAGETVTFPLNSPAVRYIRFETFKAWDDGPYVNFDEIAMWGQPQ